MEVDTSGCSSVMANQSPMPNRFGAALKAKKYVRYLSILDSGRNNKGLYQLDFGGKSG